MREHRNESLVVRELLIRPFGQSSQGALCVNIRNIERKIVLLLFPGARIDSQITFTELMLEHEVDHLLLC